MPAASLRPNVSSVDFGLIREAEGAKSAEFYVVNTDTVPLAIIRVVPTCGCTAADFTRDEIAPGDSAMIRLKYDPNRRPGRFNKAVKVYPSHGEMIRVPIEGVVDATPETIEYYFPVRAGEMHLTQGTIINRLPIEIIEKSFYVDAYNAGTSPLWIDLDNDDQAVEMSLTCNPVPPKEKVQIGIHVKPDRESRQGTVEYTVGVKGSPVETNVDNTYTTDIKIITEISGTSGKR